MSRARHGFTLVELLVVITIIGILMALLFPAVMSAIAIARRSTCGNNIRQVASATAFHTTKTGSYPGYVQTLAGRTAPWTVTILPFLSRSDVHDVWAAPSVPDANLPRVAISIYQCPSDAPADRNTPQLSYVANVGASSAVAESSANGVFLNGVTGTVRASGMRDNEANTVMFSENRQATDWPDVGRTQIGFMWHPTTTPLPQQLINGGTDLPLSEDTARPSSHHRGGAQFAFCDTRVAFINETIDYRVQMQLMTSDASKSDMPAAWKSYILSDGDY